MRGICLRGLCTLLAIGIITGLNGCAARYKQTNVTPYKLPYEVEGASDKVVTALEERFRKYGVRLMVVGQDFLISIPSTLLFPNQSPQLTWGSYALLNDVACYMRQFRKVAVNVSTYGAKCVSPRREHALTLARSRAVADYLWSQGIDSRFIFTEGQGSDKPIVSLVHGSDDSPNSRIEITFRNTVA